MNSHGEDGNTKLRALRPELVRQGFIQAPLSSRPKSSAHTSIYLPRFMRARKLPQSGERLADWAVAAAQSAISFKGFQSR